jgi:hypothetical protein
MRTHYLVLAATLGLTCAATQTAHAKEDKLVTITGCVQGFAQGGYFLSDATDAKGKTKHYLLVNDNDELKEHEGRVVEVSGSPAPFGWSVSIKAQDGRQLKTGSVFGVEEVKVVRPSCEPVTQVAAGN